MSRRRWRIRGKITKRKRRRGNAIKTVPWQQEEYNDEKQKDKRAKMHVKEHRDGDDGEENKTQESTTRRNQRNDIALLKLPSD